MVALLMSFDTKNDIFSNDVYFRAIEGSDSGLWVCDLQKNKCYLSNRYYTMLGYSPGEFEPTMENLFSLLHPDDVELSNKLVGELFQGKTEIYRHEVRLRGKEGSYHPILTQGLPERSASGEVIKIIGWNIDITLLKETQKKLDEERAVNIAQSRLAQLGILTGGISHEINNPLTVIQWRTQRALREMKSNEPYDRQKLMAELEGIEESARRISEIIKGLQTIATGGNSSTTSAVNLTQVMREILSVSKTSLETKGIRLHQDFPELDPKVKGNFALLGQVILNLINNAVDALEGCSPKDIWIKIQADEKTASIKIEDNGQGIAPENQERIMLPFFTTKEPGKGTGLGLSISKSIVQSFKGTLSYHSVDGKTLFIAKLPLAI